MECVREVPMIKHDSGFVLYSFLLTLQAIFCEANDLLVLLVFLHPQSQYFCVENVLRGVSSVAEGGGTGMCNLVPPAPLHVSQWRYPIRQPNVHDIGEATAPSTFRNCGAFSLLNHPETLRIAIKASVDLCRRLKMI